jgi:hypothetical protein
MAAIPNDGDFDSEGNTEFKTGKEEHRRQRKQTTLRPANTSRARRVRSATHSVAQVIEAAIFTGEPPQVQQFGEAEHVDERSDTGRSSSVNSGAGEDRIVRTGLEQKQQLAQETLHSANTGRVRRVNTAKHSTAQAVDAAIFPNEPPHANIDDTMHVDKCEVTGRSSLVDSRAGESGVQEKDITQVGAQKSNVKRKRAISRHTVSHDKNKKRCLEIPEDEDPGAKEEKPMETVLIPVVRPSALRQATMEEYLRDTTVPE